MSMTIILMLIGGVVIAAIVAGIVMGTERKKAFETAMASVPGFVPGAHYIGQDGKSGIAMDLNAREICFFTRQGGAYIPERISFDSIVSSEIDQDGMTITKTNRGSQLVGAAVGGALLGGVGALMGGLSGSTRAIEKVQRIDLVVTVNDAMAPLRRVRFFEANNNSLDSALLKVGCDSAQEWHARISVVLKQQKPEVSVPA